MKIGAFELYAVETGQFALDGGAMFGVVPKTLWQRKQAADLSNRIDLALRSLLLRSQDRCVLIDTGIGSKLDAKLSDIYKVDFSGHNMLQSLQKLGLQPEEITDVILTHLHFDHAGGTTFIKNNRLQLTFPAATHHVQAEQWHWAINPSEKDRASFIGENFLLLESSGRLHLLDGPGEILPGVETLVMYGHTPGMQLLKIHDQDSTLLYCADLIPTATHVSLPWIMAYDNAPLTTLEEKKRLLPMAVEKGWYLFFEHDPVIKAGRVVYGEKGFSLMQTATGPLF